VPSLDLRFADNKSLVDATTGAQLVTFTRASSGTFVGSDGVIRTAVTNLWTYSEQFEIADWAKTRSSISTNTIAAPNGTLTADTLIEDSTATNTHQASRTQAVTVGITYTWSIYCKTAGRSHITLSFANQFPANSFADFNLSAGTIASTGALGAGNVRMQPVGDSWYRLSITAAASSTATATLVAYMNNGTTISYTGDGTSGIYLWGAQLEQSSSVGEYIPTTSTINSAPRFDHNPATGESLGLLVEEARTNSIRNNTMVGAVAGTPGTLPTNWPFQSGGGAGLAVTIVGTGTEAGITYLDWKISGTATSNTTATIAFDRGNALTGQTWTTSSYVKLAAGVLTGVTRTYLSLIEETSGTAFVAGEFITIGPPTSASLITQRGSGTRALSGGATVALIRTNLSVDVSNGSTVDFTLRIGLPQLEQGAFATSVIPTSTTAVTRSADVASISGSNFSSWYRQDEGSFYAENQLPPGNPPASTFPGVFSANNGTATNQMMMYWNSTTVGRWFVRESGTITADVSASAVTAGSSTRMAVRYASNDAAISANGGAIGSDTSVVLPTVDRLTIGAQAVTAPLNGTIRRLVYWGQRLPNSVLQSITQ
jgi:hypothetical protein